MIAMTILQAFKATMIDLDKASAMANSTVPIQAETLKKKHKKNRKHKKGRRHITCTVSSNLRLYFV